MHKIEILASADKALKKINPKDRALIAGEINKLSKNPRPYGYKKLKGTKFYRIRIGNFRVIYQINNKKLLVLVVRIAHRKEVYKK
ncbi:MAG TPA: type II toxin-antitoxin system RelE/ParE family toxin [Ignavibacteria bacterium]|nr:type II toxin-antitoxin system RelE/ParE family toxin [Ignavibacteria bacterium]